MLSCIRHHQFLCDNPFVVSVKLFYVFKISLKLFLHPLAASVLFLGNTDLHVLKVNIKLAVVIRVRLCAYVAS